MANWSPGRKTGGSRCGRSLFVVHTGPIGFWNSHYYTEYFCSITARMFCLTTQTTKQWSQVTVS
ncbi:hypothetical protein LEMLEM_LOCUS13096 [Lemmus lemmus]